MEMAVKTAERGSAAAQGGGGAGGGVGNSSRAAGIKGERRPLASLLHGFLGALPHGDEVHGGGKNVALVAGNSWVWGVGHDQSFLHLYSFSDSRHPI